MAAILRRAMDLTDLLDGHEPTADWLASDDAQRMLSDVSRRVDLYRRLHPGPDAEHGPLLRALLEHECAFRRATDAAPAADDDDSFENLYRCALLLFQLGRVEDVLPLWRAKHIDMDTGCGLDIQFLVGAGVDETLAFLAASSDPAAREAGAYIADCRLGGDFDDLPGWLAWRRAYFA